ncbi:hypothetical protein [Sulfurimonas marina]|uniref:Uncharacterized protein n=1 Tax=Sulfurimonas marina TaxID=2590551 RepID=A0A7M3V8Z3_9BACT|nr:hypothetical protein [Sulfurimonas marina]QOP40226.1 hypothetical protein FJR03_00105 [Sulfurimonas marina]
MFIEYEIAKKNGAQDLDNYYEYKGVDYLILSTNAKLQINDEWVDAVLYTNSSNIYFMREKTEFFTKFTKK